MRLSHDGGREKGTRDKMIMLKRIVSVMVSCVFISMVCIPAAHADDAQGSIDLNVQSSENSSVQSLNNDGDASGKAGAEPFNPCKQVSSYTLSYESYMTNEIPPRPGTMVNTVYGFYVVDADSCMPLSNVHVFDGTEAYNRYTDENGYVQSEAHWGADDEMFEQREWWRNDTAFTVYSPDGYNTPVVNISCNESGLRELKDCHAADSTLNAAVFVDSRKLVGTVLLSKHYVPPVPVLTSFPMTGKYALTIVISLVLIAGISMVFIHRYGRK